MFNHKQSCHTQHLPLYHELPFIMVFTTETEIKLVQAWWHTLSISASGGRSRQIFGSYETSLVYLTSLLCKIHSESLSQAKPSPEERNQTKTAVMLSFPLNIYLGVKTVFWRKCVCLCVRAHVFVCVCPLCGICDMNRRNEKRGSFAVTIVLRMVSP